YCARLQALIVSRCSRSLGTHLDAEDIAQSVFRAVFHGVKAQGYDVPDHQELWGLLLVLALNKIRNQERYYRSGKRDVRRRRGVSDVELGQLAGRDDATADFVRLVVEDELNGLPDPHRVMVKLRLEGYDLAEITTRARRSTRTVERVLQTFRKRLAEET